MNTTDESWVCVLKTSSRFEAEAARGNLESAGLRCVILNKQDSSYLAFGYVEVHVPSGQAERARQILTEPNTPDPELN